MGASESPTKSLAEVFSDWILVWNYMELSSVLPRQKHRQVALATALDDMKPSFRLTYTEQRSYFRTKTYCHLEFVCISVGQRTAIGTHRRCACFNGDGRVREPVCCCADCANRPIKIEKRSSDPRARSLVWPHTLLLRLFDWLSGAIWCDEGGSGSEAIYTRRRYCYACRAILQFNDVAQQLRMPTLVR